MKTVSHKKRILIPLTVAMCVLLGAFILNVYQNNHREISNNVDKHLAYVEELFAKQLTSDAELMSMAIEMLSVNPNVQSAWLAQDRVVLLRLASPILSDLRDRYRITHFYFHDRDRRSFLRVYNPERFGDVISRSSLLKAEKTGKTATGLELGHLGTFTLRVVFPWRINGELVGYIEMGEEIDHIIKKLRQILGVELYVTIYKFFLDREKWESGMRMLGREGRWGEFPTSVVVSQTLKQIPHEAFRNLLSEDGHEYMEMAHDISLLLDGRKYRIGFIPIYDSEDREVGDMEVLYDVTDQESHARNSVIIIIIICVVVGLVLFVSFSLILGGVDRQLEDSRLELVNARDELEVKVKERTLDLAKTNKELQAEIIERLRGEEELKRSSEELRNLSAHLQSIREDERAYIAREIHDELGQLLTVLKIDLSNLTKKLPQDNPPLHEKARSISDLIDTCIKTVQRISENLRPSLLDDLGIIPAVEWHAKEFQTHTSIKCDVSLKGFSDKEIELDKDSSMVIFRIFQETLTNVARHAEATRIQAEFKRENSKLVLTIKDNGKGISKNDVSSPESFGIIGMQERANFVGGELKIKGAQGKGTVLTITIPF